MCIVGHNKHLIFLELECVVADSSPPPSPASAPVDEVGRVEASAEDMCEKDLPSGDGVQEPPSCRGLRYGREGSRRRRRSFEDRDAESTGCVGRKQ